MSIMFTSYDEGTRLVSIYIEGGRPAISLGPADEQTGEELSAGGEMAIADMFLKRPLWVKQLAVRTGLDEEAVAAAVLAYRIV